MAGLHQQIAMPGDGLISNVGSLISNNSMMSSQTAGASLLQHDGNILGYDTSLAENTGVNGESLTVIADGSVLKDLSGNIVGTLNEDGTYTLLNNFTATQVTEDQEALLQNFENQMGNDATETPDPKMTLTSEPAATSITATSSVFSTNKSFEDTTQPTVSSHSLLGTAVKSVVASTEAKTSNYPGGTARKLSPLHSKQRPTPSKAQVPITKESSPVQKFHIKGSNSSEPITIMTPVTKKDQDVEIKSETKPAPLGSSKNPIRIIQQGNSYTSTQQLNQEQLAQIMQVVQQQQALKEAQEAGGSKVIYNSQTQTKIVYKVVNPASGGTKVTVQTQERPAFAPKPGKKRGRPKVPHDEDFEEEKIEGPELTSKEKASMKKKRPKTRSGRVSKPPKHMIEDYKHIHLLDWQEDYDDDDGGYSDYKGESDEEEKQAKKRKIEEEQKLEELQRPTFKCATCEKIYHGKRWLDTHYEQFPMHKPESEREKESFKEVRGDTAENGMEASPEPHVSPQQKKNAWNKNSKRYKLKEMMAKCPDEVLLDVMLPKLCSMVTVWEFLLMKIEDEHPDTDVTFPMIYKEFENLRLKVKQAFDENMKESLLRRVDDDGSGDSSKKRPNFFSLLKITNEESAMALGTEPGMFRVVDKGPLKPDYMFLTPEPSPYTESEPKKANRTVAVVPKDDIVHKKPQKEINQKERKELPMIKAKKPIKEAASDRKESVLKKESKIEIVSVPKDKVPGPKYKSVNQVRKELEAKKLEKKPEEEPTIAVPNKEDSKLSQPLREVQEEKKIDIKITDKIGAKKEESQPENSMESKINVSITDTWPPVSEEKPKPQDQVLQNSKPLTAGTVSTPKATGSILSKAKESIIGLPVPQRGSVVITSTSDRVRDEAEDESKKARDMATSVVSEKAKNAMGVVSDMSDLDVWAGPAKEKEQPRAAGRSVVTVEKITPIRSTTPVSRSHTSTQPRTVTISKPNPNQKMVSILGLAPLSDEPVGPRPGQHSSVAASQPAASMPAEDTMAVQSTDTAAAQALPQEEHVQMVIQHPDGSYQIIEGEEAARLMQQAAESGATFVEEPTQEQAELIQNAVGGTQQVTEQPDVSQAAEQQSDSSQMLEQPFEGATQMTEPQTTENSQQMVQRNFEGVNQVMEQPGEGTSDMIQQKIPENAHMLDEAGQGTAQMEDQQAQYDSQLQGQPSDISQMMSQPSDGVYQMMEQTYEGTSHLADQSMGGSQQMPEQPLQQESQMAEQPVSDAGQLVSQQPGTVSDLIGQTAGDAPQVMEQPTDPSQLALQQGIDEAAQLMQQQAQGEMLQQEASQLLEQPEGAEPVAAQVADQSLSQQSTAAEESQAIDPNTQTLIFQTDDGLILIRQPDGNFQVQSTTGAPINMDTVRALISSLQFT